MTTKIPKFKPLQFARPTLDTPFHINYEWWNRSGRNLRVYLLSHLCAEHRAVFETHPDTQEIDWIDEDTAQVTRVDGLQHILRIHCSLQHGYIESHTPLIDAIFRVFLANSNKALTPAELGVRIKREPETILRILSGRQIYMGLRPALDG